LKIIVLGIGNLLLSDDGVGVHVINKLENEFEFPENIRLIDGGTKGLDLLPFIEDSDRVLIVDAANFRKEPGAIDTVEGDKIPAFLSTKLSVHQIGLPDLLFAAKLMEITPSEMCLIGIQPKSMETGTELSEEVKNRLDVLTGKVLQQLKDWGADITSKTICKS
jgi:hydrogenase maturation protease